MNEAVNAEYTLLGDLFGMDAKQERTGRYSQRVPSKLYGVLATVCTDLGLYL